jgi:hypothetical protein
LEYNSMKTKYILLSLLGIITAISRADAQTLYGATSGGHGELYTLDPSTGGIVRDIGPLNDSGAVNYSVTGLAFNPLTGVLYGSTGGVSGTKLLTINPANGSVTVVGSFNAGSATMTDLAFDASGNLYGISSSGGANLFTINVSTAAATKVGGSGVAFTEGGGLAISSAGIFYSAPIPGEYGTYDPGTGAYTHITAPANPAGASGSYVALAFNGSILYGDDLVAGSGGGVTHLVTIDPATGTVTDIGPSVTHLDAIAFQPAAAASAPSLGIQKTTNGVVIGWPASATGFRLQENTDLTTTNWIANSSPTNVVSGTNQVTISPAVGSGFFRLINP